MDYERAGIFRIESEDAQVLVGETELVREIVEVRAVEHLLGADGAHFHLRAIPPGWALDAAAGRHVNLLADFLRRDYGRIVADDHAMALHEGLHPVDAAHFLHPGLECHRAAEALDRREILYLHGFEFHILFHVPLLVYGREFELPAGNDCGCAYRQCQQCRNQFLPRGIAAALAHSHVKGSVLAGGHAVAAEGAVHVVYPAFHLVDRNLVRALGLTASAVVAGAVVLHHVQQLQLRPADQHLQQIAHKAEESDDQPERQIDAQGPEQPV